MLTFLSGRETKLVITPSGGPSCSILNLCTILAIIMYSSSWANLLPMQDLGRKVGCEARTVNSRFEYRPCSVAPRNVCERVGGVSLTAIPQPTLRNELFGAVKVARVVGSAMANPDDCCVFWHSVTSKHNVALSKK